jgi:hypothetical protein
MCLCMLLFHCDLKVAEKSLCYTSTDSSNCIFLILLYSFGLEIILRKNSTTDDESFQCSNPFSEVYFVRIFFNSDSRLMQGPNHTAYLCFFMSGLTYPSIKLTIRQNIYNDCCKNSDRLSSRSNSGVYSAKERAKLVNIQTQSMLSKNILYKTWLFFTTFREQR